MTPAELAALANNVQIVDVRWPNEWDAGRIAGARHIPEDELDDRLEEIDRKLFVVTVCRSGSRSAAAAERLRAEGFRAENLDGGMQAWVEEGLAITAAGGGPGAIVEPQPPPDDRPPEHQRLQSELLGVLFAVQDHFGDQEPSDEEVRDFLRQRLISDGRSPEEADDFLTRMDQKP
ncbi:MAG: rhodanese-like domain-containing protein [Actinobacteria bacterium]|nr:rhodanese-like domain-containing protein [Actinomycetota bacterium]